MEVQRELALVFAEQYTNAPVRVDVVAVPENDLPKRLAAYQAAGRAPAVLRLGLEYASGYADEGILDRDAANETIRELGEDTFFAGPLALLRAADGRYPAVPVDGWVQCLWYRRDWFAEKALPPPTSWERILAAAAAFHDAEQKVYGIVVGTDPQQIYTQQTFEHVALSGGLHLFNADGDMDLAEPVLRDTLAFYRELARHGPPGNCTWREARKYYLSGRVAMMFYSPYIVDDIAGFVDEQHPIEGLAEHTDFVSAIEGRTGTRAAYGQVVSLGITRIGDPGVRHAAKAWVKFLLSDGYLRLCNMSPGGKVPVRRTIVEEWQQHRYFASYPPGLAARLADGMNDLQRWGWRDGKRFPGITQVYAQKVFPALIGELLDGRIDESTARPWLVREIAHLRPETR